MSYDATSDIHEVRKEGADVQYADIDDAEMSEEVYPFPEILPTPDEKEFDFDPAYNAYYTFALYDRALDPKELNGLLEKYNDSRAGSKQPRIFRWEIDVDYDREYVNDYAEGKTNVFLYWEDPREVKD